MRTTLTIDDSLDARLREITRKSGKSFKETTNEALRIGLEAMENAPPLKPFKVRAKNLRLKPGYNYDKPWQLIEELEGPDYQ